MPNFDLVLKNGTAVLPGTPSTSQGGTPSNSQGATPSNSQVKLCTTQVDIGVKNGKIIAISTSSLTSGISSQTKVLDCKNLHILPGVIDTQVHFREPGLTHKEDLETGTRAALMGGVTSIFEMPNTSPPTTSTIFLEDKFSRAANRSHVHFAFYGGGASDNIEDLSKMEKVVGCPGIKIFMGSSTGNLLVEDDETIEKILKGTRKRLVAHCEDEARLKIRKHFATEGKDPRFHPVWRDTQASLSAVTRLIALARKISNHKVHVLHVTAQEEVEFLALHKDIATVEVLPQHLTFSAPECYERLGTKAQQNPPIREKHHQEALWAAVNKRVIDIIGSDHAPHTLEEKARDYPLSPSGMPGVQTLVPVMLNHINKGALSIERFTELVCENPRLIFGIRGKGRIALGEDADFTIVDLKKEKIIENKWIASRCGWTPFDGMKVRGWVHSVILMGQIAMQEDSVLQTASGARLEFEDGLA